MCIVLVACKRSLTSLNSDPKHPSEVPSSTLFTGAEKSLGDILSSPNVNYNIFRLLAQQWTQTTYIDESNYDLKTRTIPDNFWDAVYARVHLNSAPNPDVYTGVLSNLSAAKKAIASDVLITDESIRKNQSAITDMLMVYSWAMLVNTFGNIPYSEALDYKKTQPKYDDAATIYDDLFARLDKDLTDLSDGSESFGGADLIYNGDVPSWRRFGNTLKLKLAMMLADQNPTKATALVNATAGKVFTSNGDNALLNYQSSTPNTNQLYVELVASSRKDYVGANTMVNMMKTLGDPRLSIYYTDSANAGKGNYVGATYGANSSYSKFSRPGNILRDPTLPNDFLDYAETEFLLAEAVERGMTVPGTAASHYNNAIIASIQYWQGDTIGAAAYLAKPAVAYATATGNYKQKIGTQKWLALYNRGFDAWTEWRRFDFPVLNPPSGKTQADIPKRYTYPVTEQNLNVTNYNQAAAAIGGDLASTKLFWDKF